MGAVVESTLSRWFTPEFLAAGSANAVRERLESDIPAGWANAWNAISHHYAADRIAALQVPVLCLAGQRDLAAPVRQKISLSSNASGNEFVALWLVGHNPGRDHRYSKTRASRCCRDHRADPRAVRRPLQIPGPRRATLQSVLAQHRLPHPRFVKVFPHDRPGQLRDPACPDRRHPSPPLWRVRKMRGWRPGAFPKTVAVLDGTARIAGPAQIDF